MKKTAVKDCRKIPKIEVIDLFCGIGGLSFGMKSKGFNILAGYDLDSTCRYAYETNNEAKFIYKDIKTVKRSYWLMAVSGMDIKTVNLRICHLRIWTIGRKRLPIM